MTSEKLQWETPHIYSLDSHTIQSGQTIVGGTENQAASIVGSQNTTRTAAAAAGRFQIKAVGKTVPYTANGTRCRNANVASKQYLYFRPSFQGTMFSAGVTQKRNFIAANFAVSCP